MLRAVLLICAVLLAQAATSLVLMERTTCRADCSDDGSDGRCAPNCISCVCCPHAAPVARPVSLGRTMLPPASLFRGPSLATPPCPAPEEILHVPKHVLA